MIAGSFATKTELAVALQNFLGGAAIADTGITVTRWAMQGANHHQSTYFHQMPSLAENAMIGNSRKHTMYIGRVWGNMQIIKDGSANKPVLTGYVYQDTESLTVNKKILELDIENYDDTIGLGVMPIDFRGMWFCLLSIAHNTDASSQSHLNFDGWKIVW